MDLRLAIELAIIYYHGEADFSLTVQEMQMDNLDLLEFLMNVENYMEREYDTDLWSDLCDSGEKEVTLEQIYEHLSQM